MSDYEYADEGQTPPSHDHAGVQLAEIPKMRDALVAEAQNLLSRSTGPVLDPDAEQRYREIETELDALATRKTRMETIERAMSAYGGRNLEAGDGRRTPEFMQRVNPAFGPGAIDVSRRSAIDGARAAVGSQVAEGLSDAQKTSLDALLRANTDDLDGSYIARRMLITESDAYRSAFARTLEAGMHGRQALLDAEEIRALRALDHLQKRAASIGTDTAGGFGVPVLIDPTIILTAQGNPNDILSISRVVTITNDEWKGITSAGVSWSFDAEAAEVSDDTPVLAQPVVTTYKAQGFIPFSIEVGMDYPNFANEMAELLSEGYSDLLASKLTTGSGSGEPFGIVTALDANTNVEVVVTTDGAFGAVDIAKLWDALPNKYRSRASFLSSTDVMNEVRAFGNSGSGGANFSVNITQESIPHLYGKPYYTNDFMDDFTAVTTSANLMIVGDFRNYVVAQRAGMNIELVPHLFGASHRPSGQRGFYAWARVGADSVNDTAFRILENQ